VTPDPNPAISPVSFLIRDFNGTSSKSRSQSCSPPRLSEVFSFVLTLGTTSDPTVRSFGIKLLICCCLFVDAESLALAFISVFVESLPLEETVFPAVIGKDAA